MTDTKSTPEIASQGELAALDRHGLPALYRPPTSELSIHNARQGYYDKEDSGLSYSELVAEYRRHAGRARARLSTDTESGEQSRVLIQTTHLPGDALAEYRQRHGLDHLRAKIVQELVKAASFEDGLRILAEHIRTGAPDKVSQNLSYQEELPDQAVVEQRYPDLTADEVSWIALLDDVSRGEDPWIGDLPRHQFFPPSLIGMDPTGLRFASNAEEIEDHARLVPMSPEELTGVTGHDQGTFYYRFRHNVAEGIKALITLSLNEADIFSQLREAESTISLLRGDSLLMQAFVIRQAERFGITPSEQHRKISDLISDPKNSLETKDLIGIRGDVFDYLSRCQFYDAQGWPQRSTDIIKLFGLGDRLPAFVHNNEPFDGSVVFYAGTLQFIDLSGRTVDSIPLAEHLKNQFSYKLREQSEEISLRAMLTRQIFAEISDHIRERNLENGNKTRLDRLQEKILIEHKVIVPIHSLWRIKPASSVGDFYASRSANNAQFSRFLKFGYEELTTIDAMFAKLPPIFTHAVSTLRKGSSAFRSESILMSGKIVAGYYTPENETVFVNVPEFGPMVNVDFLGQFKGLLKASPESRRLFDDILMNEEILQKIEHDYFHTIVHELAESVAAVGGSTLIDAWSKIDQKASKADRKSQRNLYLSRYATTNTKEDFCECCAVYFLAGETFRNLAAHSGVLREKYQFMKKLFSCDGKEREFPNRYSHDLYDVLGDPDLSWEDVSRKHFAVQFEKREQERERTLWDTYSHSVVSFTEVEDIIRRHESRGEEISRHKAAQVALNEQRRQHDSEESDAHDQRVFLYIFDRVAAVAESLGAAAWSAEANILEVLDAVFEGDGKALQAILKTSKDKPISLKTAKEMIKQLQPLVKANHQAIDQWRARYNTTSDEMEVDLAKLSEALIRCFDNR